MPLGLKRYQHEGDDHFITFSCYRREPFFTTTASKDIFLDSLELTRKRYNFEVLGYVVMPEHVHLLLSEPLDHEVPLSKHSSPSSCPSQSASRRNPSGKPATTRFF